MGNASERKSSRLFGDTGQFKDHRARFDHRGPVGRFTLAFTHSCFGRSSGHRLGREHSNVQSSLAAHEVAGRDTTGFDALAIEPCRFECLQAELTVLNRITAKRQAPNSPPLVLSVLDALWHQRHWFPRPSNSRLG